jgi:hypothetical protein
VAHAPPGPRIVALMTRIERMFPDCALLRSVVESTVTSYTSIVLSTGNIGDMKEL